MNRLYQAHLMDHYQNPRNRGQLDSANFSSGMHNPSCGDSVAIQGRVENGRLTALMFEGAGCVISQATASILTEKLVGMDLEAVLALDSIDIQGMIGMQLGITRLKCALLPVDAIKKGLMDGQHRFGDDTLSSQSDGGAGTN